MQSYDKLALWIQPQHLEAASIESLRNHPWSEFEQGIFLDDFFKPEIVARVQNVIAQEAQFESLYSAFRGRRYLSEEEFLATEDEQRFLFRSYITGVKPQYRISPNWITYLKFLDFYRGVFTHFLAEISGYPVSQESCRTISHQAEHYLKKHNDVGPHRRFCTVLYLSPQWTAECGGALHMCTQNQPEKIIAAQYNRLVIFSPNLKSEHYVDRHTEFAKDKTRDCHVAWFIDQQATAIT